LAPGSAVTETTNDVSLLPGTPGTGVTVTEKAGAPRVAASATFAAAPSFAAAGAPVTVLFRHEPDQYAAIHGTFVMTDAWTISDVMATLPSRSGNPTEGLTTHQILPWFMSVLP
jgi:hypothetical protein